jgi:hypothetical protein
MADFYRQTVQVGEFIIGSHFEKDALEYGGTNVQYPGMLIGKRSSDDKAMVTRIGTITSRANEVLELAENNRAAIFQEGETITLRRKITRELADLARSKAISGATEANPCVITCTGHGLSTGDKVRISGVNGMVELNGNVYTITEVDADEFSIDVDSSQDYTAYTSGGVAEPLITQYDWEDIALGNIADIDTDDNTVEYDGTPSVNPAVGDYVLIKDGSETPVGILHSYVNPDDTTTNKSVRYVYHGKVNINLIRNWHTSLEGADGLKMILFVDREVD